MMGMSATLILLLVFCEVNAIEKFNCIKTYQELERSVIERRSNMDSMMSAFFPPNRQTAIAADVYYFIDDRNVSLKAHTGNLNIASHDYAFRWSASLVFTLIRPELLQFLSLFVYHGETKTIKIVIDPLCEAPLLNSRLVDERACNGEASTSDPVLLLNQLTTHLKPFVIDKRLLGIDEKNRGYSSYYFNRNNTKDHCVIGEAGTYKKFRILVAVVLILVPFGIAPGIPYLTVLMHKTIHRWFTEKKSDKWYYARAMIICATLFDVAAVSIDMHTIFRGFHENTTFGDVQFYYIMAFILISGFPFGNFVLAYHIIWFKRQIRYQGSGEGEGLKSRLCTTVKQSGLLTLTVTAVQLLSFQLYFFLLAIIASPIHSISLLILCVTGIICAVMLATAILKLHIKGFIGIFPCCCLCVLPLIVIPILICLALIVMSLVGEHQGGGFVVFIVETLTSVSLMILGYFGRKVLSGWVEQEWRNATYN